MLMKWWMKTTDSVPRSNRRQRARFQPQAELLEGRLLLSAGAIVTLLQGGRTARIAAVAVLVTPWVCALALGRIEWTHASGAAIKVAVIQGDSAGSKMARSQPRYDLAVVPKFDRHGAWHAAHCVAGVSAAGSGQ